MIKTNANTIAIFNPSKDQQRKLAQIQHFLLIILLCFLQKISMEDCNLGIYELNNQQLFPGPNGGNIIVSNNNNAEVPKLIDSLTISYWSITNVGQIPVELEKKFFF